MEFSSKLIQDAVNAFSSLPGIGKKTALRMVMHIIQEDEEKVAHFTERIETLRRDIRFCEACHNVSDEELCGICLDGQRNGQLICVVENFRDVISIESTGQFNGKYYVLGHILSPLDGIGPDQIPFEQLVKRVRDEEVQELVMALSPNLQGDTTIFYLSKIMKDLPVKITGIARGVTFGADLEYADEMTLGQAINKRLPMNKYIESIE